MYNEDVSTGYYATVDLIIGSIIDNISNGLALSNTFFKTLFMKDN